MRRSEWRSAVSDTHVPFHTDRVSGARKRLVDPRGNRRLYLGFVPGALIGFLVAKFQTTGLISLIIGAAVGTGVLIGLFITGFDPFIDSEILYTGLAAIPIGAVIGLIVSTTNQPNLRS